MTELNEELTFQHYKEPLRAIPKGDGYGYYGAILMSKDMTKIQCHICGKLFKSLSFHLMNEHKTTAFEYKEKYGLARQTALISESLRWEYKQKTLEWLKGLTQEEKDAYRAKRSQIIKAVNEKRTHKQPTIRLETKNKRGTCPDQLLDKINKVAQKLGHTPSKHEFIGECGSQRYTHLIYTTFGSWSKAVELAGLSPHEPKKGGNTVGKYDQDTLLEYLRIFAQENNRVPTATDFRRGLLPSYETYISRFGGIEKARQLAGVYEFIE